MKMMLKTDTSNAEMVSILSAENLSLRKEVEDLSKQRDWLMEQMRLMKKKVFGSSSEKSSEEVLEQLSMLFDEAEAQLSTAEAVETASVAGYTRKKRTGGVEEILPDNVPVEVVEHRPDAAALNCPDAALS